MPRGSSLRAAAAFASITMQAEAPSENWLALPAAMHPPSIAGRIFETPSYVVSARMPSSAETVTSFAVTRAVSLSAMPMTTFIGTISSPNLPAASAAAALCKFGDAHDDFHRHDLVAELARRERSSGSLLAARAVFVLALPRNIVA